jgi:hypothetical protein
MIRFQRVALPPGTRAFAHREDGEILVQVSAGLTARERLAAIRDALRAAPAAGWRSPRSPVLLPALLGSAGLRRAPEGRRAYRAATATAVAVLAAATVAGVSLQGGGPRPPASAAERGGPPLTTPAPTASHEHGRRPGSPGRPRRRRPRSGRRPRARRAARPPRRRERPRRSRACSRRPRARRPAPRRPRPRRAAPAAVSTCSASRSACSDRRGFSPARWAGGAHRTFAAASPRSPRQARRR